MVCVAISIWRAFAAWVLPSGGLLFGSCVAAIASHRGGAGTCPLPCCGLALCRRLPMHLPFTAVLRARLYPCKQASGWMADDLPAFVDDLPAGVPLPLRWDPPAHSCALASEAVAAGFPSPADDYIEASIDLNRELIASPLSTFFMRVCGDAMRGDGIVDGDLLVIDRSLDPRPGQVVVASHAGRFLVRRLVRRRAQLWLLSSDGSSEALLLPAEGGDPELWGVVIHAVHHLGRSTPGRRAAPLPPSCTDD